MFSHTHAEPCARLLCLSRWTGRIPEKHAVVYCTYYAEGAVEAVAEQAVARLGPMAAGARGWAPDLGEGGASRANQVIMGWLAEGHFLK